jgi:hypothetical protein
MYRIAEYPEGSDNCYVYVSTVFGDVRICGPVSRAVADELIKKLIKMIDANDDELAEIYDDQDMQAHIVPLVLAISPAMRLIPQSLFDEQFEVARQAKREANGKGPIGPGE